MKPGERADHPIELLSASVDRELQPAETAALEAHLEGCAECRGLRVDFRRLDEAMASEPAPAVPAGLQERILAGLSSRPAPAAPRRVFRQAMPLAAAASLVAAILLWYGRPDHLPPLSPGAPAPSAADSQGISTLPTEASPSAAEPPTGAKADLPVAGTAALAPASPVPPAPRARAAAPAGTDAAAGHWKVEAKPSTKEAEEKKLSLEEEARVRANEDAAPAAASATAASGIAGRAAPEALTMAKVEWPHPVGVFAAPYIVTLEGDRRMLVNRGAYACTVPIEDDDGKLLAAAVDESLERTAAAARSAAPPASGPRIVTAATPQTRDSILRLVRERYRPLLETRCGPLPE